MAKILKPYEVPLDVDLAREILATPMDASTASPPKTLGERVAAAVAAVAEANEYLQGSQLARIVATNLMKQLKKRGQPSVRVRTDGTVILHIAYDGTEEWTQDAPAVQRATRKSDLPKLDELRTEAAGMGLDVSDLGQQRRAIFNRVRAEKERRNGHDKPPSRLVDEVTEAVLPKPPDRWRDRIRR